MKYYTFILLFSLLSCTNKKNDRDDKEFHAERQKVIDVQHLGNFKLNQAEKVFKQIKAINSNVF
jgi:archaemetzincin